MRRRLAAAAAALLLAGCAPAPMVLPAAPAEQPVIAYVPLDDRPDNDTRVVRLAESLGYRMLLPPLGDYHTALDGQPRNESGLPCGNPLALLAWVREQEAAGCDRYILSMDQMLSGGLVNARSMTEDAVPIPPHVSFFTSASGLLEELLALLTADENNRIFLLESVMRLAPTVGYQGGSMEDYDALRAYGAQARPALEQPTLESVAACYRLGADGRILPLEEYGLTERQVSDYLSARLRKLTLADTLLRGIADADAARIRVIVGIDDSSEESCIQSNEIAYLRSLLRQGDAILSGMDDLGAKAVARLYLDERDWQGASVSVRYFGGTEDRPACEYDSQSLDQIVAEHLAYFDLWRTEEAGAIRLLVLTQPKEEALRETYIQALTEELSACQRGGEAVMLMDAGNGRYGTAFHQALTEQVELGQLLSYAGLFHMANVTGMTISHGVARYARLLRGGTTQQEEAAFCRSLAGSILPDFCYKHIVREELMAYIRQDLGGDPNNFYQPEIDRQDVRERLAAGMERTVPAVARNLESSDRLVGIAPKTWAGWGSVTCGNYRFPWQRAFEMDMDITVGPTRMPRG